MLADYCVLRYLRSLPAMRQPHNAHSLALFEQVLANFLIQPTMRKNLP